MSNDQETPNNTPPQPTSGGGSAIPALDEILEDAPENEPLVPPEDVQWVRQAQDEIVRTSQIIVERTCTECGTYNKAGIFVCENCGMILATKEVYMVDGRPVETDTTAPPPVQQPPPAQTAAPAPPQPQPVQPAQPAAPPEQPAEPVPSPQHTAQFSPVTVGEDQPTSLTGSNIADLLGGTFVFAPGMTLRLRLRGFPDPLEFTPQPGQKLLIGRSDEGDTNKPDIDFAKHNALQYGISRTHASIEFHGKSVFLTDLGSTNGTFLNGIRFDQNETHEMRSGDFIKFGKLIAAVEFVEPGATGKPGIHKKTDLLTD